MIETLGFLVKISYRLLKVLLDVLSTRDVNPEVATIGGLDDGLIEVGVCDDPIEPAVEDFLVGVGFSIALFGVRSLGNLDVGCFTKGMLTCIHASDLYVEVVLYHDTYIHSIINKYKYKYKDTSSMPILPS